ncbi:MAG: hypothetical protein EOP06_00065 [Proteobacteria bacterium]|nr:MAG: hypothetical protein EOP06_00065 [Pseudomonadota bacterium]
MENYLLDPINIFATLVSTGNPALRPLDLNIHFGDENRIFDLSQSQLQKVSDYITSQIVNALDPSLINSNFRKVSYANGTSINIPDWFVTLRGKDLFKIVFEVFGQQTTMKQLIASIQKTRMIPSDLLHLLERVQGP